MIRARFYKSGDCLRLTVSGHAGYSDGGDDIVCAAASGIFYALLGYLSSFHRDGLRIITVESGIADIECSPDGEEAMKLACIGLIQLELTYEGYVAVENSVWNWRIGEAS